MKKLSDKNYGLAQQEMKPFPIGGSSRKIRTRARHRNSNKNRNIIVSCQDIRNLATTLYLESIPSLREYEQDYDYLIDGYYNLSSRISD